MESRYVIYALLFALLMIGAASAEPIVSASYSLSDSTPQAGGTVFYYVTVTNTGTTSAEDVEVRLVKSDSSYASSKGPGAVRLGDIGSGSSKTASFAISLGSSDVGVRRINTNILYDVAGVEKTIEHDDYFTVQSTQLEVLKLSSTKKPLRPAEISNLNITLINKNNEGAKDFQFDFESGLSGTTTVFKPLGGSTQFIEGQITEDGTVTVSYPIYVAESVTSGVYDATLTIKYIGGGVSKTETLDLGIWVQGSLNLDLASVQTVPTEIKEGDEDVKVAITVQNIGQETVKNLKATFNPSEPFELTASTQQTVNLGVLAPSSASTANYYVNVKEGAESGTYVIPVVLDFQDAQGRQYREEKNMTLRLKAIPFLEIENTQLPERIEPGGTVDLKITAKNTGEKKAEGSSIRVFEQSDQPFTYDSKSDNIGILDVGDEGQAVIQFTVDSDATLKEYGLEIEMRYTDGTNVYTRDQIVNVNVVAPQGSSLPLDIIVIVVLLLVAIVLAWKVMGRMRKSKK